MRRPVQQRALKSVDSIVEAAALLLEEKGLPGFNTKAIASRAGVNVATLYQYFENKQAVMRELFRRSERRRSALLSSRMQEFSRSADWEPMIGIALDGLVASRLSEPGAAALRHALEASPELQSLHQQSLANDASAIAKLLLGMQPDLEPSRADAVGRLFAHTTDAVLTVAVTNDRVDYVLVNELQQMLVRHLRPVMDAVRPGVR